MAISRVIGLLVVVGIIAIALMYSTGMLQMGESGPKIDTSNVDAALKANTYDRADTLFAAGKHEPALAAYREALAAEPQHSYAARSRYRAARCLDELGQKAEARKAYEDFLAKHPDSEHASQARKFLSLLP